MYNFQIITESSKKRDRTTYENEDFFVCWNNQYKNYEDDTIDIYRKPITEKTLFSIQINSKNGTVFVQEVFLSETYCIVRIDEEAETFEQFINIYELQKGTHVATFSLELNGHPQFFAMNQTAFMFGKKSCCIQQFHENKTKVPFLNRNVQVQSFQNKTWYHEKSRQYLCNDSYDVSLYLRPQSTNVLSTITMYKNIVFLDKLYLKTNHVITDVFRVIDDQQIKQVFSQRGTVYHSKNKAIFKTERHITIRDINDFNRDINDLNHAHVYELNINDIVNHFSLSAYQVHEKEAFGYSKLWIEHVDDNVNAYRTILKDNCDNICVDSINIVDKFGIIIKGSFHDDNAAAMHAIVNLKNKNIACFKISDEIIGVEVIQIGLQFLLVTGWQILAWMNQNLHEIVHSRARQQMYRAEKLICLLNS